MPGGDARHCYPAMVGKLVWREVVDQAGRWWKDNLTKNGKLSRQEVEKGAGGEHYGTQFAALTIGMLPMFLFCLAFQKKITQGVAAGAVKGYGICKKIFKDVVEDGNWPKLS
jgi:hypothetical protein